MSHGVECLITAQILNCNISPLLLFDTANTNKKKVRNIIEYLSISCESLPFSLEYFPLSVGVFAFLWISSIYIYMALHLWIIAVVNSSQFIKVCDKMVVYRYLFIYKDHANPNIFEELNKSLQRRKQAAKTTNTTQIFHLTTGERHKKEAKARKRYSNNKQTNWRRQTCFLLPWFPTYLVPYAPNRCHRYLCPNAEIQLICICTFMNTSILVMTHTCFSYICET